MSKRIKSISFLFEEKRLVVKANADGMFRLPFQSIEAHHGYMPSTRVYYRSLTARQVIEDKRIKRGDPVFTLANGDKVRVFQAGDPTYLPPLTEGLIQKHDLLRKSKDRLEKEPAAKVADTVKQFELDWGFDDDWY